MKRINLVFSLLVLANIIICLRFFYWQVVASERLASEAEKQYMEKDVIKPVRGEIKTSDNTPIVTNETAYLVYANPSQMKKSPKENTSLLLPIFEEAKKSCSASPGATTKPEEEKKKEEEKIERLLGEKNLQWVALQHKAREDIVKKIKDANIETIGFEEEDRRLYSEGSMAAHLIGFVGSDINGQDKGYFGLEGYYDRELKGMPGSILNERDAKGKPILLQELTRLDAKNGRNLILHIDRAIEHIVENKLKEGVQKFGAKGGSVVIMDPQNGGILAMDSYPAYDPNCWQGYESTLYKNPVVADTFEPGSIFKTLIMAAALNENVVKPETICDKCAGPRQISGFTIKTWNGVYHPNSTMTEVLEHSDNVGMVFVSEKLGRDKLLSYLKGFGIGEMTNIDLEEETTVTLRPKNDWRDIDQATVSFGQGIAITAVQMVRAVTAIANQGKLFEPHVVKSVEDPNGRIIEIKPKIIRQVIKPVTAQVLTEMMVNAVDRGEARFAKPKGYRIAGKTGTAQVPIAGHYDPTKTIASFVGFAPADNPRFVMMTILREPTASPWGSETAAPLFFDIAKEIFSYYKIAPTY